MEIEHVHFPPYRQLYIDLNIFSSCLVNVKEKGFFLPQDITFFIQTSITYTTAFGGEVQNSMYLL